MTVYELLAKTTSGWDIELCEATCLQTITGDETKTGSTESAKKEIKQFLKNKMKDRSKLMLILQGLTTPFFPPVNPPKHFLSV